MRTLLNGSCVDYKSFSCMGLNIFLWEIVSCARRERLSALTVYFTRRRPNGESFEMADADDELGGNIC
jgi:hypothetical protein